MDEYFDFFGGSYIVPPDYPRGQAPPPAITNAPPPSYETPWYVDTINRAIERASQVATIDVGGYPPYPNYPTPQPAPYPSPLPPGMAPQTQPSGGIQLSTNTLMLIVGGFLLFTLGKRGR
jgi:hypothetical protein